MNRQQSNFDEVHAAILANNGLAIDDHSGTENKLRKVHAIGKFDHHTVWLSSEKETPYFCLNRMYVDEEGKPHLSRFSVGGLIDLRTHGTLDKAVAAYNDPNNWMPGYVYARVTDITYIQHEETVTA